VRAEAERVSPPSAQILKYPLTTESAMKKIEDNNTLVFIVDVRYVLAPSLRLPHPPHPSISPQRAAPCDERLMLMLISYRSYRVLCRP
jgi:hypothetical protein